MKRRIVAFLLSMVMVVGLAACNSGSGTEQSEVSSSAPVSEGSAGDTSDVTEEEPASEEPVDLTIYFQTHIGAQDAQDDVAAAMTEITRDKLNVNVNLELIDSAAYKQALTLAFSSGEQVDLFNSCGLDSYAAVVNNGYALNLDEDDLLQTYGAGILETVDPMYLDACRVDGSVYGLPTMRDMAVGMFGLAVAAQYLDGIGYEYTDDDIIYVDEDVIFDILEKLHETYPDKTVTEVRPAVPEYHLRRLGRRQFRRAVGPHEQPESGGFLLQRLVL